MESRQIEEDGIMAFSGKTRIWLRFALITLFVLEVITLPLVVSLTYAGSNESPEHIITYRTNKLTWDNDTKVRADGSAELTLFDAVYQNVKSEQGENVLAPGTEGDNIIRLKNECDNRILYTAVMYTIRSVGELPVTAEMDGTGEETDEYPLPSHVEKESVVKALRGVLEKGQIADFTIDWRWLFEQGNEQDIIDTALGNQAADNDAQNIVMGIYIVIEDNGSQHVPETGDDTPLYGYVTLMAISFAVLIIFLITDKKRKADRSQFD